MLIARQSIRDCEGVSGVAVSVNENAFSVLSTPEIFFVTCGASLSLAVVL